MKQNNKINEVNMGLAVGFISADFMLILSLISNFGFYINVSNMMENLHMFYAPTILGTISGMIEAGIIGFIIGYLIILVYNLLEKIKLK